MKNKLKHIFFASALMAAATNFTACSLDEVNPGEFTMDSLAETEETYIIRKSKFPQNPKRSVRFSGKRTKRSVQKRKARNTQKAETKVL